MLGGMRKAANNWLGRAVLVVLFAVLIGSFAIWGIADIFRGYGANAVAKVGGVEIDGEALRRAYTDELQARSRQFRRNLTNDEARALGIDREVMQRLVSDAVLDDRARSLGVALSPTAVARIIAKDPAFNRAALQETLQQQGYRSDAAFFADRARLASRLHLAEGLAGGVKPPGVLLDAVHRYRTETRAVTAFVIPASAAGEAPEPEAAALQSFYENRKGSYAAPELRKVSVISTKPADFASAVTLDEGDVTKTYEEMAKSGALGQPERRAVDQIVFPNEEEAKAASVRIAAGASFDDLLSERKLSPAEVSLGLKSRSEMFDAKLADAAFALPEGGVSPPIAGAFGATMLRVSKIEPSGVKPLAEIRGLVEAQARQRKIASDAGVRAKVEELHDKIEDQRASGRSLAEIAKDLALPLSMAEVSADGRDRAGAAVALPAQTELLRAAFGTEPGVETDALRTPDQGYLWYELNGVEPARQRAFDEVRGAVLEGWRAEEVAKRLVEKSRDLAKRLRDGANFDALAAEVGATTTTLPAITRANAGPIGSAAGSAVFAVRKGDVGEAAAASAPDRVVFRLDSVAVLSRDPNDPAIAQVEKQITTQMVDDLVSQYVAQGQTDLGLSINERLFRQVVGGGGGDS